MKVNKKNGTSVSAEISEIEKLQPIFSSLECEDDLDVWVYSSWKSVHDLPESFRETDSYLVSSSGAHDLRFLLL